MAESFKQRWRRFQTATPGHRFRKHFEERQRARRGSLRRLLAIAGGFVLIAAGLFFLPAPGPGTVVLLLGAALLAEESSLVARGLDRAEVRARATGAWSRRQWLTASPLARTLIALTAAGLLIAAGVGSYQLFFGS